MVSKIEYHKREIHYCDICNKRIAKRENVCEVCDKEICKEHKRTVNFSDFFRQYHNNEIKYRKNILYSKNFISYCTVCSECFKMKEEYLGYLFEMIEIHDKQIIKIVEKWKSKSSLNIVKKDEKETKETNRAELMDLE